MKKLTSILTAIFLIAICSNTLSCSNSAGGGSSESGQNTSVSNSGNTGNTSGGTPTIETKTGGATITLSDGKKVTVTYNDCGNATNPINYTVNENTVTVTFGTAPAKTGHTFGGWYDNASCNGTALTEAVLAEKIAAGQDINIYAKWTEIAVTSITLNKTTLELEADNAETLTATVTPSDAFNKTITWTSSNASVATVENGVVTTKAEGSATITATAASGVKATCAVTVKPSPTKTIVITLEKMKTANNGIATTVLTRPICRTICSNGISGSTDKINAALASVENVIIEEGVTAIGTSGFFVFDQNFENLKNIKLPTTVTSIGEDAFFNCPSLKTVNLPEGLVSIGTMGFNSCVSMESITIPSTVTSIGKSAFYNCSSLKTVNLQEGLVSIGESWFDGYAIESITIPSTVTSIGKRAFYNCSSLKTVNLQEGLVSIGEEAFRNCVSMESITIPSTITSIGKSAFHGCASIESITIPSTVTVIETGAFNRCTSLATVNILSGITKIGDMAFYECTALESIRIPSSVNEIESAFGKCVNLKEIIVEAEVPPETHGVKGINSSTLSPDLKIYVPSDSVEAYKTAWSNNKKIIFPIE